jgi:hypothetical protein
MREKLNPHCDLRIYIVDGLELLPRTRSGLVIIIPVFCLLLGPSTSGPHNDKAIIAAAGDSHNR